MDYKVHPLSDVQAKNIGDDTMIWQFVVVLPNAKIGKNCNINCQVFIENDVEIGDNVTIKSGVQVWDGVTIEDNVFVGPNVAFTNDLVPRSKQHLSQFRKTIIKKGASIGANATILSGIEIGQYALVGAGSVITKSIPPNTLWFGNPAIQNGYITNDGIILDLDLKDKQGNQYKIIEGNLHHD
jgi:UDP-2-acetamido-3-amino-2,3-dideoxy-glucuronate N-acetyltransferase